MAITLLQVAQAQPMVLALQNFNKSGKWCLLLLHWFSTGFICPWKEAPFGLPAVELLHAD